MLRRAGPSLRHFLLERNSSAGHSSCSREVWNAQWDWWQTAGRQPRAAQLGSKSRQSTSGKATLVQLPLYLLISRECLKDPDK